MPNQMILVLIDLTNKKHHFGIQRNAKFLADLPSFINALKGKIAYPRKFWSFHLPHYSNQIA